MNAKLKIPIEKTGFGFFIKGKFQSRLFFVFVSILFFLFSFFPAHAQIKVSNMIEPNDSWGMINVNNLFGGCMQVDTHAAMYKTDVQFLKRGMLFVVYDDDLSKLGTQTAIYMFSPPAENDWPYNNPFDIPKLEQNNTIATAGLTTFLKKLNISPMTDPENKTNVYFDASTNQFYRYDDSTDPATYLLITPSASNVSVVAQNGIASTNVQSALEELQTKISTNALRFEYEVKIDGVVEYPVGFELQANSHVFLNGVLLDTGQWTTGASVSDIKLLVSTLVYDKIKIQR